MTTVDPTATLQRDFDSIGMCIAAGLLQAAESGIAEVRLRTATLPADHPARQRLALFEHQLETARDATLPPSPGSDLGFCATCGAVIEYTGDHWRHLHVADHPAVLKF